MKELSMTTYFVRSYIFHRAIFELLENSSWVIRGFFKRIKNAVAHFDSGLESGFFAAILAVRVVLGELIPLAANTESPALKGGSLVRIACDVSLGHILFFLFFDDGWSMVDSCRV